MDDTEPTAHAQVVVVSGQAPAHVTVFGPPAESIVLFGPAPDHVGAVTEPARVAGPWPNPAPSFRVTCRTRKVVTSNPTPR